MRGIEGKAIPWLWLCASKAHLVHGAIYRLGRKGEGFFRVMASKEDIMSLESFKIHKCTPVHKDF